MKKRIISALLCLITVLSLFTTAFATDNLPETVTLDDVKMFV